MANYVSIFKGDEIDAALAAVPNKVDKEAGKGLSEANFTNAEKTKLSTAAPLASPEFTGVPTAPTAPVDTNNTQIANTAFVQSNFDALGALGSTYLIAGVTAAQIAASADIAIGNFVAPEQFFVGDLEDPDADWLSACQAALATGKMMLLRRMYGLSEQLDIPANRVVVGLSRDTTGFKRIGSSPAGGVVAFSGNNVTLRNFKIDADNIGSAPDNRLNCLSVNSPAKNFNISQVDVYNATGYGHVTFGTESAADVTGVYFDCRSENCQVLFEQIGALDVTLYSCIGQGVAGRTLSIFHPYAGSKRVTHIDCHGFGAASAGIEATTTSGVGIGPFTFIDSSISIQSGSAIVSATVSGGQANTDLYIRGGRYRTDNGQSASISNRGIFKFANVRLEGYGGFNCPPVPENEVIIELIGCQVIAALDSAGAQVNALITNGSNPKIIGGSVEAYNALAGGKVAILGNARVSRETTLIPDSTQRPVFFRYELPVVATFTAETGTTGFVDISLPAATTITKVIPMLSISRNTDTYSSNFDTLTFNLTSATNLRVRYAGNDTSALRLHGVIGILP